MSSGPREDQLDLARARIEGRRRESLEIALCGPDPLTRMMGCAGAMLAETDALPLRTFPTPPGQHFLELTEIVRDLQELIILLRRLQPPEEDPSARP